MFTDIQLYIIQESSYVNGYKYVSTISASGQFLSWATLAVGMNEPCTGNQKWTHVTASLLTV